MIAADLGLVRKDSIEELVGHRNVALELARKGLELLAQAEAAARRAAPSEDCAGFLTDIERSGFYSLRQSGCKGVDDVMKTVRHHVDYHAWRSLQSISGLRNLMDTTAHEKFSKQLDNSPPEFTAANTTATFMSLASQAPQIFERSIITVFERLNTKRFKTNSAFQIGKRIILTSVFSWSGIHYGNNRRELIQDLDRIMHMLDGKKPPEAGNAADAFEKAYKDGGDTATTDYFSARMFRGNGNLHLTFLRPDLMDRANRVIARHYGQNLPDNRKST